jgi:hypothetical protein
MEILPLVFFFTTSRDYTEVLEKADGFSSMQ